MLIGIARIEIYIPMATSLKEKRRVIKGLIDKARNKFNIAIAEVDNNDLWKNATIGIVTISNERAYIDKLLSRIINFIERFDRMEIINYSIEVI
ncbi:MAG: uncharacterized protein PWR10_1944 [Halanaerobiales bacterium]|nr:uncharacterized protein [Halanaerobiales bacterium]